MHVSLLVEKSYNERYIINILNSIMKIGNMNDNVKKKQEPRDGNVPDITSALVRLWNIKLEITLLNVNLGLNVHD